MAIVQTLSSEIGKRIEKRYEMILAHEKFGVEIKKKIKQIALDNKELDANDIYDIVAERYGYNKTVRTIENILQRHRLNRGRGRRSKKTVEKKIAIQSQRQRLEI